MSATVDGGMMVTVAPAGSSTVLRHRSRVGTAARRHQIKWAPSTKSGGSVPTPNAGVSRLALISSPGGLGCNGGANPSTMPETSWTHCGAPRSRPGRPAEAPAQ